VTARDALIDRIAEVRRKRATYMWVSWYLPGSILIAGVALLGLGLRRRRGGG